MKSKLFIILLLIGYTSLVCLAFGQSKVKLEGNQYTQVSNQKSTTNVDSTTSTVYTHKDKRGKVYPDYKSKNGKPYVWKVDKNGKKYKYYIKPLISQRMKRWIFLLLHRRNWMVCLFDRLIF